jgi:hypothetical protein
LNQGVFFYASQIHDYFDRGIARMKLAVALQLQDDKSPA